MRRSGSVDRSVPVKPGKTSTGLPLPSRSAARNGRAGTRAPYSSTHSCSRASNLDEGRARPGLVIGGSVEGVLPSLGGPPDERADLYRHPRRLRVEEHRVVLAWLLHGASQFTARS